MYETGAGLPLSSFFPVLAEGRAGGNVRGCTCDACAVGRHAVTKPASAVACIACCACCARCACSARSCSAPNQPSNPRGQVCWRLPGCRPPWTISGCEGSEPPLTSHPFPFLTFRPPHPFVPAAGAQEGGQPPERRECARHGSDNRQHHLLLQRALPCTQCVSAAADTLN